MEPYRTIKALVFDYVRKRNGVVDYDELTAAVLHSFPGSRWDRTHWAFYRYEITKGRFTSEFSDEVKNNLLEGRWRGQGAGQGAWRSRCLAP